MPKETLAVTGAGPEVLTRVVSAWSRFHGFISLEIGGNFSSMSVDADALFRQEVNALLQGD